MAEIAIMVHKECGHQATPVVRNIDSSARPYWCDHCKKRLNLLNVEKFED